MSRKGNPYDNAQAESFFKTLKSEEVDLTEYGSMQEVRQRINQFIGQIYNKERLHSALGYVPPVEFEIINKRSEKDVLTLRNICPARRVHSTMFSRVINTTGIIVRNRVHIVTCSSAAVWGWAKLTGTSLLPEDLITVPLTIACIYLWNRLHDLHEDRINSPNDARMAIKSRLAIQSFCMVAVPISLGLSLLRGEKWAVSLLIFVMIIGFLYSTPLSQHSPRKRLKNIFLVKNLISILGWSLLTVVYPAAHSGASINVHHWFAFMVMSATVFIVEIIWDIRDLDGDQQAGIKTIPVELGVTAAIQWVVAINSFSALITLGGLYFGVLPLTWLFVLVNNLLVAVWIWQGGRKILIQRVWSHALVALQTVLLICLGLLAVFVDAQ